MFLNLPMQATSPLSFSASTLRDMHLPGPLIASQLIELRVAGYGDCYSYDEFVAYYGIDADDYWRAAQILPQSDWRRVMQRAPDDCCLTNALSHDGDIWTIPSTIEQV